MDAGTLAQQRQLFEQGNKLYDQGKLPEAEAAYIEAWKLRKSYDVAGNLGNLQADLKKWRSAAEFLSYAIREFPAGGKPGLRDELLKRLGEVERQVGKLRVNVARPGAEVFVDGTSVGLTPLPGDVYVEAGTHAVEVRQDGFSPTELTVTAAKGQTEPLNVVLETRGGNKAIVLAGGVVAGVAAITGAVFVGLSFSEAGTANSKRAAVPQAGCPIPAPSSGTCADLKGALDSKNLFANAALWSFVGAGAVGVATLIYGLAGSSRGAQSGLLVTPAVTAQGGGLFVSGSF